MQLQIQHSTYYSYDTPVDYALQKVRLNPVSSALQEVGLWQVSVTGGKVETNYTDHYGNHVDLVSAEPGTQKLVISAQGSITTNDKAAGILGKVYGRAPLWHFKEATPLTEAGEATSDLASALTSEANLLDGLHLLSEKILKAVPYEIGATNAATTANEALMNGKGVCQDHANIFIAAARAVGVPARYVSGYLMMDGRVDQDASHAWAEAHVPELGWVGYDVSNGISPDGRYVRLAVGRDAHDAAPISGLRHGAGNEDMVVTLQVQQ